MLFKLSLLTLLFLFLLLLSLLLIELGIELLHEPRVIAQEWHALSEKRSLLLL